jgi:hypothetical protein
VPGSSALSISGVVRPGTASFLPLSAGIQNEWITSSEVIASSTFCPAGITRSLAVVTSASPSPFVSYSNPHHHWWPTTSTVTPSLSSPSMLNSVETVPRATTPRMAAGSTVHPISSLVLPWVCAGRSSSSCRRRNRNTR